MSFKKFKTRLYKSVENQPAVENDKLDVKKELVQAIEPKAEALSTKLKSMFGFKDATLTVEDHMKNIEKMTKAQLGEYAEQYEINLDRRRTKENMINEFIQKLKEKN